MYSFFCARPFDQKLGFSLIHFFYLHTTVQPKYMVFFHLFFLLCTTIEPKIKVLIDLFLLFVHDHAKITVLIDLFLLSVHDHSTEIHGPLSFILSFVHNYSTKN